MVFDNGGDYYFCAILWLDLLRMPVSNNWRPPQHSGFLRTCSGVILRFERKNLGSTVIFGGGLAWEVDQRWVSETISDSQTPAQEEEEGEQQWSIILVSSREAAFLEPGILVSNKDLWKEKSYWQSSKYLKSVWNVSRLIRNKLNSLVICSGNWIQRIIVLIAADADDDDDDDILWCSVNNGNNKDDYERLCCRRRDVL